MEKQKNKLLVLKGLGLKRINDSRVIENTPENLGMINTVRHMVNVENIEEKDNAK